MTIVSSRNEKVIEPAPGTKITFAAGKKYLWPTVFYQASIFDFTSELETSGYIENFHVATKKPGLNKLLFYRVEGGLGDAVTTWPFLKILHEDFGYQITVITNERLKSLFEGFPFVDSISQLPALLDDLSKFDSHCFFGPLTSHDEHAEQLHPVDLMLKMVGIDPSSISSSRKVVSPVFYEDELAFSKTMFKGKRPIGVFAMSSSDLRKSIPPAEAKKIFSFLISAFPEIYWLGLIDFRYNQREYLTDFDAGESKNFCFLNATTPRRLLLAIRSASIVVSPDSFAMHGAGSMGVPCVALYGPTDPSTYLRYYKNQTIIHNRQACVFSPCNFRRGGFLTFCPTAELGTCAVMAAITPEMVAEAVRSVLAK